jgi:hypothetical protein
MSSELLLIVLILSATLITIAFLVQKTLSSALKVNQDLLTELSSSNRWMVNLLAAKGPMEFQQITAMQSTPVPDYSDPSDEAIVARDFAYMNNAEEVSDEFTGADIAALAELGFQGNIPGWHNLTRD